MRESAHRVAQEQVLKQNGVGMCKVMLRRSLLGLLCGRVCRGVEVCREGHAEAYCRNWGNVRGECVPGARIVVFFYSLVVCDEIAYLSKVF